VKPAHPLSDVVAAGYAPSVRWLVEHIRRGDVPGFRVGRKGRGGAHHEYRMTDDDIEAFIESRRITKSQTEPQPEPSHVLTLTPRSARYHRTRGKA
jgi:hypothetical protein